MSITIPTWNHKPKDQKWPQRLYLSTYLPTHLFIYLYEFYTQFYISACSLKDMGVKHYLEILS